MPAVIIFYVPDSLRYTSYFYIIFGVFHIVWTRSVLLAIVYSKNEGKNEKLKNKSNLKQLRI